ncbi:DNA repair protein rhp54 [Hordeum vulgare]|nr:DNA repair protein rhp54 [Hordeum vulgare]
MDDGLDLDAAAGLISLASSDKGKPCAPQKAAAPKPKKVLTPEQRAKESAKRKDRRHATDVRDEAITRSPRSSSTGSTAFPRTVLPDSPGASVCKPVPGFQVYPQASRLSEECSPEVSVVAPSTPAPATIDLNATSVAAGSSTGGARKHTRQTPADQLPGARNLFDKMPAAGDDDYMKNMIFKGGAQAAGFDPDETQS